MTDSKALAKKEEAALALYEEDAGAGWEGANSSDDFTQPFIVLLQGLSPQVDKNDGAYVEGAEPGMFLDASTGELFKEFDFVPCYYDHCEIEWRDRLKGGGFVARHEAGYAAENGLEREMHRETGRWTGRFRTGPDTHVQDTRQLFGLRLTPDGAPVFAIIALKSTQIPTSKKLMSALAGFKFPAGSSKAGQPLPLYAHHLRVSSKGESRDTYRWSGFKFERLGYVTDEGLKKAAVAAYELFERSAKSVRPPDAEQGSEGGGDGQPVPF